MARCWDVWPGMDDSVTGRGERGRAHPRATGPPPTPNPHSPPPTSNMPYYVDLWRWLAALSTESGQGPSKDLSPRKIKGGQGVCQTKANSEGQARS